MNKTNVGWVSALSLFLPLMLSNAAFAQGVPIGNGVYACDGAAQAGPCQPQGDNNAGYSNAPIAKWADRWGAIAGGDNGAFGIVEGKQSKRDAQSAAIEECRSRGGGGCQVKLAYYNQCAAVAANTRFSTTYRAPTLEEAKSSAMAECNNDNEEGGGACWVYYSGCSLPERIR